MHTRDMQSTMHALTITLDDIPRLYHMVLCDPMYGTVTIRQSCTIHYVITLTESVEVGCGERGGVLIELGRGACTGMRMTCMHACVMGCHDMRWDGMWCDGVCSYILDPCIRCDLHGLRDIRACPTPYIHKKQGTRLSRSLAYSPHSCMHVSCMVPLV